MKGIFAMTLNLQFIVDADYKKLKGREHSNLRVAVCPGSIVSIERNHVWKKWAKCFLASSKFRPIASRSEEAHANLGIH
jgi:hypothetical protein